MRLRLFALLLVAVVSGSAVGLADRARASRPIAAAPLRAPAPLPIDRPPNSCPLPDGLRDEFRTAATEADVPIAMLVAVARVESDLRVDARSPKGAHGLLQVLPSTAAELELDAYHVGENVLAGARYLRMLLDRFQSTELAFAAYNAGPTAVELEGARPNDETVAYVADVTTEWRRLVGCT
jgi:soluble lytic murein transglycosylase-like protein